MFKLNFQSERFTDGSNIIKHTRNVGNHTYHVFVIPESLSETCIPPSPGDIYVKASNKKVYWVGPNGDVIEWKGNSGSRAKFHFGKASVLWWNGQDIGWFPASTVSTHTTWARGGNVDWAFITSQAAEAIVCAVLAGKVRKPHKRRRVELEEPHSSPPHHLESKRVRSSENVVETRSSYSMDASGQDIVTNFTTLQDNPSAFDSETIHAASTDTLEQTSSCVIEDALPPDVSTAAAIEGGDGEEPVPSSAPPTLISTPYLRDWTPDACLTDVHGECPADTPTLEWFNGLKTVSPLNSHDDVAQAIQFMVKCGKDATQVVPGEREPFALTLDARDFGPGDKCRHDNLVHQVRQNLMAQRPVLVTNWSNQIAGSGYTFDQAAIKFFGDPSSRVCWQDSELEMIAEKRYSAATAKILQADIDICGAKVTNNPELAQRAESDKKQAEVEKQAAKALTCQVWGKFDTFLAGVRQPSMCANILDRMNVKYCERPWFISDVSDDLAAWENTCDLSWKSTQRLADSHEDAGPGSIPYDCFRYPQWKILTMAGFMTLPHHDADGLCTWGSVTHGMKIWGYPRAKPGFRDDPDLLKGCNSETHDLFVIFLTPGSVLIQPPGKWHLVYTPIKSMMIGGHFVTLESILPMLTTREMIRLDPGHTNADHRGVERVLGRILINIVRTKQAREVLKESFIALLVMVLDPESYRAPTIASAAQDRYLETVNEKNVCTTIALKIGSKILGLNVPSTDRKKMAIHLRQILESNIDKSSFLEGDCFVLALAERLWVSK